jgi:hypothetical protein
MIGAKIAAFGHEPRERFLVRSISPVERKRPWTWSNQIVDGRIWVSEHPGKIKMPRDFLSHYDFSLLKISGAAGLPLATVSMKSVFTTASRFLGYEKLLRDGADLDPITDAFVEWNERFLELLPDGTIKFFVLGDDIAGNFGLMMSPKRWFEWVRPAWERLFEVGRSHGCTLVFHSDGDVLDLLPSLANMGVEIVLAQAVGRLVDLLISRDQRIPRGMRLIEHDPGL